MSAEIQPEVNFKTIVFSACMWSSTSLLVCTCVCLCTCIYAHVWKPWAISLYISLDLSRFLGQCMNVIFYQFNSVQVYRSITYSFTVKIEHDFFTLAWELRRPQRDLMHEESWTYWCTAINKIWCHWIEKWLNSSDFVLGYGPMMAIFILF